MASSAVNIESCAVKRASVLTPLRILNDRGAGRSLKSPLSSLRSAAHLVGGHTLRTTTGAGVGRVLSLSIINLTNLLTGFFFLFSSLGVTLNAGMKNKCNRWCIIWIATAAVGNTFANAMTRLS